MKNNLKAKTAQAGSKRVGLKPPVKVAKVLSKATVAGGGGVFRLWGNHNETLLIA